VVCNVQQWQRLCRLVRWMQCASYHLASRSLHDDTWAFISASGTCRCKAQMHAMWIQMMCLFITSGWLGLLVLSRLLRALWNLQAWRSNLFITLHTVLYMTGKRSKLRMLSMQALGQRPRFTSSQLHRAHWLCDFGSFDVRYQQYAAIQYDLDVSQVEINYRILNVSR